MRKQEKPLNRDTKTYIRDLYKDRYYPESIRLIVNQMATGLHGEQGPAYSKSGRKLKIGHVTGKQVSEYAQSIAKDSDIKKARAEKKRELKGRIEAWPSGTKLDRARAQGYLRERLGRPVSDKVEKLVRHYSP